MGSWVSWRGSISACTSGSILLHVFFILSWPDTLGTFFSWLMVGRQRQGASQTTHAHLTSGPIVSTNIPLAKAENMSKLKVNGVGNILCLPLVGHTQIHSARAWHVYFCITPVHFNSLSGRKAFALLPSGSPNTHFEIVLVSLLRWIQLFFMWNFYLLIVKIMNIWNHGYSCIFYQSLSHKFLSIWFSQSL